MLGIWAGTAQSAQHSKISLGYPWKAFTFTLREADTILKATIVARRELDTQFAAGAAVNLLQFAIKAGERYRSRQTEPPEND